MNQKRGQGLSTNAIILIILGVIVLAILILGFTLGWSRFVPFIKTDNINTIQSACSLACSQGVLYDFCTMNRTVTDGTHPSFQATCNQLSNPKEALYKANSYIAGYGIEACSQISCP